MRQAMSLREPESEVQEPRKTVSLRMRDSLREYVAVTSERQKRDKTAVIEDALLLDRDLAVALGKHRTRLRAYAKRHDLDMDRRLVELIVALVVEGLDAAEEKR